MNIVLTIHHDLDKNSGAPGVTIRLAEAFRDLGHNVEILSFGSLPNMSPRLQGVVYPWWIAQRLLRLCRQRRIDVVDASTGDAAVFGPLRHRFLPHSMRPLLVTRSHGLEHTGREALLREVAKGSAHISWRSSLYSGGWRLREVASSLRTADLVFVLNERDRLYARDRLRIPENKVVCVRNGINAALLGNPEPSLMRETETIGIAHIGSFSQRKGAFYLTRALDKLLDRHRLLHASFYGPGVPKQEIMRHFSAGMQPRINIVESFDNSRLWRLLDNHQIGILASSHEGLPGAVLEMMACGVAPIVTATAGSREIVVDKYNGLVVPFGDSDAIEDAVETLMADPDLLHRLRLKALKGVQVLSWQTIAREQSDRYEAALARRTQPRTPT